MIFSKIFNTILPKSQDQKRAEAYRRAIREEAKVGGKVFGEVPGGRRREFFCLDEFTWVWHEEWDDSSGKHQVRTTRYDIRPNGVYKAQDGQPYQPIGREEAKHLIVAAEKYQSLINEELAPFLAAR